MLGKYVIFSRKRTSGQAEASTGGGDVLDQMSEDEVTVDVELLSIGYGLTAIACVVDLGV